MKQVKRKFVNNIISEMPDAIMNGTMCLKPYFTEKDIIKETAKEVLIPLTFRNVSRGDEFTEQKWVPKSCIEEVVADSEEQAEEISNFNSRVTVIENIKDTMYPYGLRGDNDAIRLLYEVVNEEYISVSRNAYINMDAKIIGKNPKNQREYNELKVKHETEVWEKLRTMLNAYLLHEAEMEADESATIGANINNADLVDRFNIAQSIDNIMSAQSADTASGKIVKYERGNVYVRVGYILYDANVVICTTDTGKKLLLEVEEVI